MCLQVNASSLGCLWRSCCLRCTGAKCRVFLVNNQVWSKLVHQPVPVRYFDLPANYKQAVGKSMLMCGCKGVEGGGRGGGGIGSLHCYDCYPKLYMHV